MIIKKIMLFNQANENGFLSVGINVKYHPMPLIAVENMMGCNAVSLYQVNSKYHPIPLLAVTAATVLSPVTLGQCST